MLVQTWESFGYLTSRRWEGKLPEPPHQNLKISEVLSLQRKSVIDLFARNNKFFSDKEKYHQ